jgi:hypothetical protein
MELSGFATAMQTCPAALAFEGVIDTPSLPAGMINETAV